MKLAKKMLAGVLALAMVAALALTAFAASTIVISASDAKIGETMKVTVSGKDIEGLGSGNLTFKYNADVIEFVGIDSTDNGFIGEGGKVEDGEATFAFMYAKAATADTAFCVLSFKVLKAGDTGLTVDAELSDKDDAAMDAKIDIAAIEVTSETNGDDTPDAPGADDTTAPQGAPATGEVGIAAIAGVMAIAAVAFVATRKKDEE